MQLKIINISSDINTGVNRIGTTVAVADSTTSTTGKNPLQPIIVDFGNIGKDINTNTTPTPNVTNQNITYKEENNPTSTISGTQKITQKGDKKNTWRYIGISAIAVIILFIIMK